jgi:hypothetical protein
MTNWKPIGDDPPKDGRPVLLWARLKSFPAEKDTPSYLVIVFWHSAIGRWKPYPEELNRGEDLLPTFWAEISEPPDLSRGG